MKDSTPFEPGTSDFLDHRVILSSLHDFFLFFRAPIDEGSERTIVISNEVTMCDGLAVDWLYSHIYWTDTGKNTIELANYEGSMHKTLIRDSLDEPRAIALNPLDGFVYLFLILSNKVFYL